MKAGPPLSPERIRRLRRRVLSWFSREARSLPWRGRTNPYEIWVSEVMLQQTRVEVVRERWPAFVARFPSVDSLARASTQDVLRAWEGLGYYARARNLHRAARHLVRGRGGALPRRASELSALPGLGPYTAAAVASIAYGEPAAVLDGNVMRVLGRVLAESGDPRRPQIRRRLEACARALLAPRRSGTWNQALMDIGATVCRPRRPRCLACPLRLDCRAAASGLPESFPGRSRRPERPHFDIAAGLVWKGQTLLIGRRPDEGLLGGLWEFPGGKVRRGEPLASACAREVSEETGYRVRVGDRFVSIDHAFTHFRITLHLFHCTIVSGRLRPRGLLTPRFVPISQLKDYPFPRANRKALLLLAARGGAPVERKIPPRRAAPVASR